MEFPIEQIEEFKKFHPEAQLAKEGGITFFFLPDVALPDGCIPERMNLLLCPTHRDGYPSRLYFSERVTFDYKPSLNPRPNWNGQIRILDETWYAFSWKTNPNLRLIQMISAHIDGIRK